MAHSHKPEKEKPVGPSSKLVSLVAQFDDPDSLVAACDRARREGYQKMDAYSPFPVHGIDDAIGIRRTRLPFFVLAIAFCGLAFALFLQYYVNSTDESPLFPGYKFFISGKPLGVPGVPANIPVTFEIIVLSSAFATFFGMWILNGLPRFANPLHRIPRFRRATNDRFFLVLEAEDEKFNESRSRQQLEEWGATAIEECHLDLTDHEIPKNFKMAGIVLLFALLLPPALIYRAAGMTNRNPRLHVVPDMDWQDKFKTQTVGPNFSNDELVPDYLFGDPSAMRHPVAGTIARGDATGQDEFHLGYKPGSEPAPAHGGPNANTQDPAVQDPAAQAAEPEWLTSFPGGVQVSEATIARGKQRFEIYCTPCHGFDGNGGGLTNQHAQALAVQGKANWTAVKSLHDPAVKSQAVGRIFDTITNGRATMGPYQNQIPAADRWAIVMYVKALQQTGIETTGATAEASSATEAPAGN
ncbi:MAG: quinol:electron acceptor oxidoreductase subunit ActD [Pirellulaceae bacterium]